MLTTHADCADGVALGARWARLRDCGSARQGWEHSPQSANANGCHTSGRLHGTRAALPDMHFQAPCAQRPYLNCCGTQLWMAAVDHTDHAVRVSAGASLHNDLGRQAHLQARNTV